MCILESWYDAVGVLRYRQGKDGCKDEQIRFVANTLPTIGAVDRQPVDGQMQGVGLEISDNLKSSMNPIRTRFLFLSNKDRHCLKPVGAAVLPRAVVVTNPAVAEG